MVVGRTFSHAISLWDSSGGKDGRLSPELVLRDLSSQRFQTVLSGRLFYGRCKEKSARRKR